MTTYSIISLIAVVAYIPLLTLVLRRRPWQRIYKLLTFYLITATIWSLTSFFLHSSFFVESKTLLVKFVFVSMMWMATHYYYFVRNFGYKPGNFGVIWGYGFVFLFIALAALDYMPKHVFFTPGKPIIIDYGPYIWLLAFPILSLAGMLLVSLLKKQHISTNPLELNLIRYLLLSLIILIAFSSTNLLPLSRGYPIVHFGNLINAVILTYATLRYELVSLKFVAQRSLAYGAVAGLVAVLYFLIHYLLHSVFRLELNFTMLIVAIVITVLLIGSFWYGMVHAINQLVDRLFYGKRLDYRKAAINISRQAASILDLAGLGKEITQLVNQALGARAVYLFIKKANGEDFILSHAFPETALTTKIILKSDSPILTWLRQQGKYLTLEELDILPEFGSLWEKERKAIDAAQIELFFPLITRNEVAGILALTKPRTGISYDVEDINLLQLIVAQIAVLIHNAQLYTEARRMGEELNLINKLTQIITSSPDIGRVYKKFTQELRKVMDADWASVVLLEGDKLRFFALSSIACHLWKQGDVIKAEGTATAYVVKTKRALAEDDLLQKHLFWTGKVHLNYGIKSIVYVPLLSKGEGIGALIIGSQRPQAYGVREVGLLEQLAGQLATAIENFCLYQQLQRQAITDELTGLFNRRYFENRLTEEIVRYSRYGKPFSVLFLDMDNFKNYNDGYGHRAGDSLLREISQIIKKVVRKIDLCFRYGGDEFAIISPETTAEEAYEVAERVRTKIASEMEIKKIVLTVSLGVACFPADGATGEGILRAADTALFYAKQSGNQTCIFSKIVTIPSELVPALAGKSREILEIIQALVTAVDAKDHYTYSHSQAVTNYAVALGRAAALPPDRVAILNIAALLHDVGKIGIPDELLNKEDKITNEEWETLRSHSSVGVDIISQVSSLAPCIPIILHHHERYNAKGYPERIGGETIPIEARILAVADAFAAIISQRPYRPALSYKEAIEELKRGSGTQFDPKLVELFIPIALSLTPEEVRAKKP